MDRRFFIGAGVLALAGGGAWLWGRTDAPRLGPVIGEVNAQEAAEIDTSRVIEMSMGAADAPITMIEYASFTCPHCRSFHENVFGSLKADYIDTGKVRFIYREVYFDKFGLWAAMVARCGGEMRYFGIADMLYERQPEWISRDQSEVQIVENLRAIGRTAGISNEELDACLSDGDMAQAMVAVYQQNAEADDIDSTPSFVIDGTKYANMGYQDMSALLDEKLGG